MSKRDLVSAFALAAIILVSYAIVAVHIPVAHALDGNLYVSSSDSNEVKRYNTSTGTFIDNFVPSGSIGLVSPVRLAFGPDGNLYVGQIGHPRSGIAPPSLPQTHSLTVNAVDLAGKPISGVWTVIRLASDGSIAKTGFTPLTFTDDFGTQYKVSVANYDGKIFQKWDDASTSNTRTIGLSNDTTITAVYDTGDSLRGFTSLTYTGTAEQPDLTVNAAAIEGNKTLNMWTVIDPQSSDLSAGTTTYLQDHDGSRIEAGNNIKV